MQLIMASDVEKDFLYKLRSLDMDETYEALVKIQNHAIMKNLQKNSLLETIVPLMEHPRFCNITLNIVADGCLEKDFVNELINYNGIKSLLRIINSCLNDDLKKEACRALSNIVKFDNGFKAVHLLKPVSGVVNFLSETNDVDCQQIAVHTLMVLGKSSKTKDLINRENGFTYIVKLLQSPNIQVLICSVKALAKLTYNCSLNCARQLVELHCHEVLIELYPHSEHSVTNYSLILLKNLSSFEELRTRLVKAGAVKLFVEVLSANELHEKSRFAVFALCKCLDHLHMWDHNGTDKSTGLKTLLDVLKNKHLQDIHISVISSLIPLSYELSTSDILLNLDVLQILIEILNVYINTYKCKLVDRCLYGQHSDCKLNKGNEEFVNELSTEKQSENDLLKDNRHFYSFENVLKVSSEKQHEPYFYKWDSSMYGLSSATSDYCGSCSPNRLCSPIHKYSSSPEYNYDIDVSSPSISHTSSGVWSPVSLTDESMPYHFTCWSPVVSNCSISPIPESEFIESEKNEATITGDFSLVENVNLTHISNDSSLLESDTVSKSKNFLKNSYHEFNDFSDSVVSKKRLKTNSLNISTSVELHANEKVLNTNISSNSENNANNSHPGNVSVVMNKTKTKPDSFTSINAESMFDDNEQSSDLKLLNENGKQQTIDQYVILFIFQLSFHIEKKPNSQMANKSFFSILIDYLCLIHKPSLKAETLLLNLVKNRYWLEKVIVNGFFCELEEKMAIQHYSCINHYNVKQLYSNLINVARQEIDSDYGIGTLSHVIIKSDKIEQLHGICTLTKLVIKKTSINKLFFDTNFLSLLLDFLHESDVSTRKKAAFSLGELYQSLIKLQKAEKCCFNRSCSIKTSSKCYYKESFLNVAFSVIGGGKILANREKICQNSPYFKALLQGHFKESNTGLVVLPHISAENLSTIFHFLHGCGKENLCPNITRIPLSVLLELLSDSEKFLLSNIKLFVEDKLCHQILPPVIPRIYKESKINNSPALAKKCLHKALSIDSSNKDLMWDCFKELAVVEPLENFNEDINNLFKNLLSC